MASSPNMHDAFFRTLSEAWSLLQDSPFFSRSPTGQAGRPISSSWSGPDGIKLHISMTKAPESNHEKRRMHREQSRIEGQMIAAHRYLLAVIGDIPVTLSYNMQKRVIKASWQGLCLLEAGISHWRPLFTPVLHCLAGEGPHKVFALHPVNVLPHTGVSFIEPTALLPARDLANALVLNALLHADPRDDGLLALDLDRQILAGEVREAPAASASPKPARLDETTRQKIKAALKDLSDRCRSGLSVWQGARGTLRAHLPAGAALAFETSMIQHPLLHGDDRSRVQEHLRDIEAATRRLAELIRDKAGIKSFTIVADAIGTPDFSVDIQVGTLHLETASDIDFISQRHRDMPDRIWLGYATKGAYLGAASTIEAFRKMVREARATGLEKTARIDQVLPISSEGIQRARKIAKARAPGFFAIQESQTACQ